MTATAYCSAHTTYNENNITFENKKSQQFTGKKLNILLQHMYFYQFQLFLWLL